MSGYAPLALETLKQKGFRLTRARRLVIETLDMAREPLSPYEIAERLVQRGEKVDTVSVYRILERLEESHLIHRLMGSGKALKCAIDDAAPAHHDSSGCHHLLICQGCHSVEEVACPGVDAVSASAARLNRFRVRAHQMEFLGLCAQCQ
ncbi:MAG: transcriptional repressor [Vampirovibrionales bacterium]|nr:transcriptional repressor [Vampirovibrionales bacterium]